MPHAGQRSSHSVSKWPGPSTYWMPMTAMAGATWRQAQARTPCRKASSSHPGRLRALGSRKTATASPPASTKAAQLFQASPNLPSSTHRTARPPKRFPAPGTGRRPPTGARGVFSRVCTHGSILIAGLVCRVLTAVHICHLLWPAVTATGRNPADGSAGRRALREGRRAPFGAGTGRGRASHAPWTRQPGVPGPGRTGRTRRTRANRAPGYRPIRATGDIAYQSVAAMGISRQGGFSCYISR